MRPRTPPDARLKGSRGAILGHLRRGDRTVAELAHAVGLTRNGVRLHLARLEREGLVTRVGVARGVSKSSRVYGLTGLGGLVYSRAYSALLRALIDELGTRSTPAEVGALLRAVARRMAGERTASVADPRARLASVLDALRGLGGDPVVTRTPSGIRIALAHCPLAELTSDHPDACTFGRSLVEQLSGVTVEERCEHGPRPRCRFELPPLRT